MQKRMQWTHLLHLLGQAGTEMIAGVRLQRGSQKKKKLLEILILLRVDCTVFLQFA